MYDFRGRTAFAAFSKSGQETHSERWGIVSAAVSVSDAGLASVSFNWRSLPKVFGSTGPWRLPSGRSLT